MTDDDRRVDPRYDPAFQRGFDGPVVTGPAARAAVESAHTSRPLAGHHRTDPREPEPDEPAPQETEPDEPAPARRLSRNPFLIALVVLGGILTVGGIAWANQARMLVSVRGGAATDLDYWFLQSSAVAAPLTILAGVGILAGVLFVAATAWNRR